MKGLTFTTTTKPSPPSSSHKLKFLCSFNGSFVPRRPSGDLRYAGGETRLVSIDRRGINLSRLRSKLSDLCFHRDFSLRYKAPHSHRMISIFTDRDLHQMIEFHDWLVYGGDVARLRVFLCDLRVRMEEPNPNFVFLGVSDRQNWILARDMVLGSVNALTHQKKLKNSCDSRGGRVQCRGKNHRFDHDFVLEKACVLKSPSGLRSRSNVSKYGSNKLGSREQKVNQNFVNPVPSQLQFDCTLMYNPNAMDQKIGLPGFTKICPKVLAETSNTSSACYARLAPQELQIINNSDLEEIRELGSGAYGTVFYGKWKGSDVAIKRIKSSCFVGGDIGVDRLVADFWKEACLLGQLHHPNVVAFYGVVKDGPEINIATVTEYMVNGSLKQVLRRKDRTIDRKKRLIIAMDAAFGMEYLHEKNIVHFDLKSHNLLVNMKDPHRPVCKIGDLGLSKVKQRTLVSGGVRGTIPWMAPELLSTASSKVSEKVDVYSFGIVMWELLTGEEPYQEMRTEDIIAGMIEGCLRPDLPSWCDPAWRSLMERCWSSDPASRPTFSEISKELRAIAASIGIK